MGRKPTVKPELKELTTAQENAAITETEKAEITEKINFDKTFRVINPEKANCKLFASTGELIEFNEKGEALLDYTEAKRFSTLNGYTIKEK